MSSKTATGVSPSGKNPIARLEACVLGGAGGHGRTGDREDRGLTRGRMMANTIIATSRLAAGPAAMMMLRTSVVRAVKDLSLSPWKLT